MGLFLLDVFYFPTPRFLAGSRRSRPTARGFRGRDAGRVSGLIVGPCTGPILAVASNDRPDPAEAQGLEYALQIVKGGLPVLFGLGRGR